MLKDKFNKIVEEFSKEVKKEILTGNYEVLLREKSRVTLYCLGETFDVWVNSDCYIWLIRLDQNYYTQQKFQLGEDVHKKLMIITEAEKEKIRLEIEEKKQELENLLKGVK